MTQEAHWHVGEYGFNIDVLTGQDLSGFTSAVIRYTKPSGTSATWTASIVNNDSDGVGDGAPAEGEADDIIRYAVTSTDLDSSGLWTFNAEATDTSPAKLWIGNAFQKFVKAVNVT